MLATQLDFLSLPMFLARGQLGYQKLLFAQV